MTENAIILSIRPTHAAKIFSGVKTVELRRIRPLNLSDGALALIYVTSPVRSLAGAFRVTHVVKKPLADLWEVVQKKAGLTYREFQDYYAGVSTGTAIFFRKVWSFPEPLSLEDLRGEIDDFLPPRAFRYVEIQELSAPRIAKLLADITEMASRNNITVGSTRKAKF